ncbi:MAG: metallophosphoesterase [Massilibacteroides sp.]|nr:metallophosphoesterase [Massilibacteroides sp.]
MQTENMNRRRFLKSAALTAGALGVGMPALSIEKDENEKSGKELLERKESFKKKLSFNKEGKFRIVQFTDIHAEYKSGITEHAFDIMNKVLDIEKPDFVIYTGDIVTDFNPVALWEKVTGLAYSRSIPFAVVLGNHDSERDASREEVYNIVVGLKGCLNEPKKESIDQVFGYTNQVIPIYESEGSNKKSFIFYLFDSNALNNMPYASRREDWIRSNQIEWYVSQSNRLAEENGRQPYPALAFFHIPLIEYNIASNTPNQKMVGWRIEKESLPPMNSGLFSAFKKCNDVKGVFVGHDHDNDYVTLYQGIALGYGRFSGGNGAYHTLCRGARVIELTRGEESFETWTRLETGRYLNRITVPQTFISDDPEYRPKP